MGITIHCTFMQERGYIKGTLDHAESVARKIKTQQADKAGVEMSVERLSERELLVNIEGCESLMFRFALMEQTWDSEWSKEYRRDWEPFDKTVENNDHVKNWPEQETYWCDTFCKTQFGKGLACHIWVAEITRAVAGTCKLARVNDEGDYYHNRDPKMAQQAIAEVGGMITNMMGAFEKMGYEVIKSNEK